MYCILLKYILDFYKSWYFKKVSKQLSFFEKNGIVLVQWNRDPVMRLFSGSLGPPEQTTHDRSPTKR